MKAGLAAVFTFPLNHGDTQLGALDHYRGATGGLSATTMAVARFSGDEFVVFCEDLDSPSQADLIQQRLITLWHTRSFCPIPKC